MTADSGKAGGYMTVTEAAREMGISERALHNRIKAGTVTAERFGARVWMIPATEVQRFRGAGRLRPGPKPRKRAEE